MVSSLGYIKYIHGLAYQLVYFLYFGGAMRDNIGTIKAVFLICIIIKCG